MSRNSKLKSLQKNTKLRLALTGFTLLVLVYLFQNLFDSQYYQGAKPYRPLRIDQTPPHYGLYYLGKGLRVILNDLGMVMIIRSLISNKNAQSWAWWTMGISALLLFPAFIIGHYFWGPAHPVVLGFLHRLTLHPLLMIALLVYLLAGSHRQKPRK